jgi:hypothetical protein
MSKDTQLFSARSTVLQSYRRRSIMQSPLQSDRTAKATSIDVGSGRDVLFRGC